VPSRQLGLFHSPRRETWSFSDKLTGTRTLFAKDCATCTQSRFSRPLLQNAFPRDRASYVCRLRNVTRKSKDRYSVIARLPPTMFHFDLPARELRASESAKNARMRQTSLDSRRFSTILVKLQDLSERGRTGRSSWISWINWDETLALSPTWSRRSEHPRCFG